MAQRGAAPEVRARHRLHEGELLYCRHQSASCAAPMRFALYLPPGAGGGRAPLLLWLSGLTCTEENFMVKAGAQRYAAELGIALLVPDTSPRDTGIAGEDADYDLGSGAGFYVNASAAPWSAHYRMFDYINDELPEYVAAHFPVDIERRGVTGHSMGGHGALISALSRPELYRSVSAFSPICAPTQAPWGIKAFSVYLGEDRQQWRRYDATELIKTSSSRLPLLVDQGEADEFLEEQLMPQRLVEVCRRHEHPLELHMRTGYDHSYYFIASFIGEHLRHHAAALLD